MDSVLAVPILPERQTGQTAKAAPSGRKRGQRLPREIKLPTELTILCFELYVGGKLTTRTTFPVKTVDVALASTITSGVIDGLCESLRVADGATKPDMPARTDYDASEPLRCPHCTSLKCVLLAFQIKGFCRECLRTFPI